MTLALRSTSLLTIAQLINALVPFLFVPFYSRIFDAENFSLVMVSVSIIQLSTVFTDFGFNISAIEKITNAKSKEDLSKIISGIYLSRLIIFTLFFIPWLFFILLDPLDNRFFLIILTAAIFFQVFQAQWLFLGLRKPEYIIYSSVASRIIFALLILFFVKDNTTVNYVAIAFAMSALMGSLVCIYLILKDGYRPHIISFNYTKILIFESAKFFWSRMAVTVYSSFTSILLASTVAASSYALYSVCEQLYKGGQLFSGSVSLAILPETTKTGKTDIVFFWAKVFTILGLLGVLGAFVFGGDLLGFLFGQDFVNGSRILLIFAIIFLCSSVSVMFGYPFFAAKNALQIANNSVMFGAALHSVTLSILYFSNIFDIYSAGIAILTTEVCIMLFRILYIKTKF